MGRSGHALVVGVALLATAAGCGARTALEDLDGGAARIDASMPGDAGRFDAGRFDAGRFDAGRFDAGRMDAGRPDASRADAGPPGPCIAAPPRRAFPVLRFPYAVDVADVNGDGVHDFVVSGERGSLLLSDGSSFRRGNALADAAGAWRFGDFDRDGDLDLLGDGYASLVLQLGFGDGTFASETVIAGTSATDVAAIADVDANGTLDIVVLRPAYSSIPGRGVLWGNGDGTFRDGPTEPGASGQPKLALQDLDDDGRPDLVEYDGYDPDHLRVLRGVGDGTFVPQYELAMSASIASLTASFDIDTNGTRDLLIATDVGVQWLEGNGDGSFRDPRSITNTPSTELDVDDVDGDGRLDFLSAYSDAAAATVEVSVFRGAGDATATLMTRFSIDGWLVLQTANADGDGITDLLALDSRSDTLRILDGNGDGTFQPAPVVRAFAVSSLVADDVDRDGLLDLVANQYVSGPLILAGDGNGSFEPLPSAPYPRVDGAGAPLLLSLTDFDGDARSDLLINLYSGLGDVWGGFDVALGSGVGYRTPVHFGGRSPMRSVTAGELDGDGRMDVAFITSSSDLATMHGNGDGTFRASRMIADDVDGRLCIGDVDRDGDADIVSGGTPNTVLFRGHGDGSFDAPVAIAPASNIVVVADADADGILDLVVVSSDGDYRFGLPILVSLGNGDGTFRPARTVSGALSNGFTSPLLADVDQDGWPDLAFLEPGPYAGISKLHIYAGNGDGTFRDALSVETGIDAEGSVVGDFNGDGRLDIAVGNYTSATVVVINTCGLL